MALFIIILFVLFYWFVFLPKQVQRHVYYRKGKPFQISYYADFSNLKDCIKNAQTMAKLDMCAQAVKQFKRRNKYLKRAGFNVDLKKDVHELYNDIRTKIQLLNK
jgi:hypothetical protein